jgi:hypothetical protein
MPPSHTDITLHSGHLPAPTLFAPAGTVDGKQWASYAKGLHSLRSGPAFSCESSRHLEPARCIGMQPRGQGDDDQGRFTAADELPDTDAETGSRERRRFGAEPWSERFSGRIEVNVQSPIGLYADPVGVSGILTADRKKSAHDARDLLSSFETIARTHGVAHDHSLLSCRLLEIPRRIVDEARFCDLAMVPLSEAVAIEQDTAEQLVFESGRPILVFPDDTRRKLPTSLKTVAVAWDSSGPATSAIKDALPLLQQAKKVRVSTSLTTSQSTNRSRLRNWPDIWRDMVWKSLPRT